MAYAESESMALKRLKVALKRKDWQFFDYGIIRTNELINSGNKISEIQQWYELLDTAKNEAIPEEQIQKLSAIIESILTPAQSSLPETNIIQPELLEAIENDPEISTTSDITNVETKYIPDNEEIITETVTEKPSIANKLNKIPLTIFINKIISSDQIKSITSIRYYINKLSYENSENTDFEFLSILSNLLSEAYKEKEKIQELIKLIKTCPEPGVIITSSYNSELTNLLTENEIDYSIDGIKKPKTTSYWKLYLLRGSSSIFCCPKCKNKTFYNNDEKTLVTSCKKCSAPAFPDLYEINSHNPQTNPQNWYHAFQALTNSENWLLISPPKNTENKLIYDLISTALSNTELNQAYIVSNDSKTTELWKNNLNQTKDISVSSSSLLDLMSEHLHL